MSTIVAVSPALEDAVLSAGGTLARHAQAGHAVILICVFGGPVPSEPRIQELLGLGGIVHVGLPRAPKRGYGEAQHHGRGGVHADDAETLPAVQAALAVALGRLTPELVLAPLGLGGHVDAHIVTRALDELALPRLRWVDLPYGLTRTPGAPLGAGEPTAIPIAAQLEDKLAACALLGAQVPVERLREHALREGERLGAGGAVELLVVPVDAPAPPSPG